MAFLRRLFLSGVLGGVVMMTAACGGIVVSVLDDMGMGNRPVTITELTPIEPDMAMSNTPEAVAGQVLANIILFDFEAVAALACDAIRDDLLALGDDMAEFMDLIGDITVDMSGVVYTVIDQTETSATVILSGDIVLIFFGIEDIQPASELFGEEGLPMVFENGQWLACDPALGF